VPAGSPDPLDRTGPGVRVGAGSMTVTGRVSASAVAGRVIRGAGAGSVVPENVGRGAPSEAAYSTRSSPSTTSGHSPP